MVQNLSVCEQPDGTKCGCGASYAFAAQTVIQTAYALKKKTWAPLWSVQQILECSWAFGNGGCDYGNYDFAWDYFASHKAAGGGILFGDYLHHYCWGGYLASDGWHCPIQMPDLSHP